jgi:hypothetical protein
MPWITLEYSSPKTVNVGRTLPLLTPGFRATVSIQAAVRKAQLAQDEGEDTLSDPV